MVFRVGVGKKIGGFNFFLGKTLSTGSSTKRTTTNTKQASPKPKVLTAQEIKDREFQDFLLRCESDVNENIMEFFRLNGYDPLRLQRSKIDLDDLFYEDDSYQEFAELVLTTKEAIEKVVYSGDTGIQAKRDISDKFFVLKGFINRYKQRDHINPKYAFLKEPEPEPEFIKLESTQLPIPKQTLLHNEYLILIWHKVKLILLWVGILFTPYIFAWFTLGKKFSKKSRVIAFSWLAFVMLIILFRKNSSS